MRTLVLGATGYVGRNIVPRLIVKGHQVRCLVRDPNKISHKDIELVHGDATDVPSLEKAIGGIDKIVYLIHSMSNNVADFEEIDRRVATNVASIAKKYSVKQIVYLGGLGKKNLEQTPHLRSRHEVAQILRSSDLPVTELRAAVIIGAGSASFEMIRTLVTRLPIMICPKWVSVKTQPIAIDDILSYLSNSLENDAAHFKIIDIGGPDIISYRDMMITVGQKMGLRRIIIPVPVLTPWLSSHWVNLVTSVSAPLAQALIESVRSETICENDLAYTLFNHKPIGFEKAVEIALLES